MVLPVYFDFDLVRQLLALVQGLDSLDLVGRRQETVQLGFDVVYLQLGGLDVIKYALVALLNLQGHLFFNGSQLIEACNFLFHLVLAVQQFFHV